MIKMAFSTFPHSPEPTSTSECVIIDYLRRLQISVGPRSVTSSSAGAAKSHRDQKLIRAGQRVDSQVLEALFGRYQRRYV
jgi:hypothetical protein